MTDTKDAMGLSGRSGTLSNTRLLGLIDLVSCILYEMNASTLRVSFASLQAEQILGYPIDRWTQDPAFLIDHTHPEDRALVLATYAAAAADRRDRQFEFRMIAADGRTVRLRNSVAAAAQDSEVRGAMYDVTEQRKAETACREADRRFLALFDNAPVGAMFVDPDGKLLRVNDTLCSMLGYGRGELENLYVDALTHPDDVPVGRELRAALLRGALPSSRLQERYIHKQGHVVWGSVATSAVKDESGNVACFVSQVQDMTEQKTMEERERQRSRELAALLNIATVVSQSVPFEQKARRFLEEIVRVSEVDWVALRLPDDEGLRLVAAVGPALDKATLPYRVPPALGAEGRAFIEGSPVITDGSAPDAQTPNDFALSRLAMPIMAEGQTLGVLSAASRQKDYFVPARVRVLLVIANGMGPLLQNARLLELEQQRAKALEALFYLASILVEPRSFEEKLDTVLKEIIRVAEASTVLLWVPEDKTQNLRIVAAASQGPGEQTRMRTLPVGKGLAGMAFQRGQTVIANTYVDHPAAVSAMVTSGARSAIAIPIGASGSAMGVLEVFSLAAEHFTPERLRLILALGGGIGALLENIRLYEQLREELEQDRRHLDAIWEVSGALALEQDPDQAVLHIVESARRVTGACQGTLSLWAEDGRVTQTITSAPAGDRAPAAGVELDQQAILKAIRGKADRMRRAAGAGGCGPARPAASEPTSSMRGFLGAPVICKDRLRAGLYVTTKADGTQFTGNDELVLNVFATLAGVLLDNSEMYRSVAREHATLAAIQSSMTEGLVVFDANMRVAYCNNAAAAMADLLPADIIGATADQLRQSMLFDFDHTSEQGLGSRLLAILQGLSDTPFHLEGTVRHPKDRELALTVFPILVEKGKRMAGVLVRDVTRERELERRRDTFVAVASHELRTPMTTIMGFVELLLKQDPPSDTRRRWLQLIHKDSLTLTSLIDDLLNVSRIQSGKLTVRQDHVLVRPPIAHAVDHAKPSSDRHAFVIDVPSDIPSVVADGDKLTQVLVNLLSNAVKYSPSGGPITVSARHEPDRNRVVIAVNDCGMGIAPQDQARLFTTFERVHRPETEGIRGSGLGLYVVKAFVELMGGEVWLESVLNSGSTFYLSLRASAPEHSSGNGTTESKS